MLCIYCSEKEDTDGAALPEDCLTPEWVAYASHDFSGDDLRRRWDDPEVEKLIDTQGNSHPVVYAGAGSHASYFNKGEYLAELELPFLSPLVRLADFLQNVWVKVLRQATGTGQASDFNFFRIPFVDYARGDGLSIGPGQKKGVAARYPGRKQPPGQWAFAVFGDCTHRIPSLGRMHRQDGL